MIDHRLLRENPKEMEEKIKLKEPSFQIAPFLEIDQKRRDLLQEEEMLKQERNKVSQEIAKLKAGGEDAGTKISEMQGVAARIKDLEEERQSVEKAWYGFLANVPNKPASDVPKGKSEADNKLIRTWGEPCEFDFTPKPHWELGKELDIIDIERGGKVTGSRFYFMKGAGALLERALINFFLDYHTQKHGYREIFSPFMVNADSMFGTGQLPKFEEDLFRCDNGYYLIPTAEVPLTNIYRQETLQGNDLPTKICGYSACFRSEAGAHGRDTRGIIRVHQFNKVELVNFVRPEDSFQQLEILTGEAERMLQLLELPYRVVALCAGDLGFSAAFTYDLEVWVPSANTYREVSSCSNFTDFQARRANIRFRREPKAKAEFVHTLNGSGLALPRTVVAVIENNQDEKGRVRIPRILQPYMGGLEIIG